MLFLEFIQNRLKKYEIEKILIAYSGGIDSHVLLHLLAKYRAKHPSLKLRAVHVNHKVNSSASDWQTHCEKICEALSINLTTKAIIPPDKVNEAKLRDLRYQVFTDLITTGEYLLTAHSKTDQAETVLLQLLRGAGPTGLAAMPEIANFNRGYLLRPLLNVTRDEIIVYAEENHLQWIEDDSNNNIRFDRNFLRQKIFPPLIERWPGMEETITRSAKHCANANKVLDEVARQDLQLVMNSNHTLAIDKLLKLSVERQANVLRTWIRFMDLPLPSQIKIKQIQKEVLIAREDANPLVTWKKAEVRRYRNELFAMQPLIKYDVTLVIDWNASQDLQLPNNCGVIKAIPEYANKNCQLRFRHGGEQIKIDGRAGTHSVKKLMQEYGIPPWLRDRAPLLYVDGELVKIISPLNLCPHH